MKPVAIIGLATLAPEAVDVEQFWDNIVNEIDCITEVPPSRWDLNDYYDPDPFVPDKTYARVGGFIPEVDFDPLEFGLPPNILEVTDTSQLLSLLVAKQGLLDAGYSEASEMVRERTGVILGVGGGQKLIAPLTSRLQYPVWDKVLASSGIAEDDRAAIIEKMKKAYVHWEENSFPGLLGNVIAGRITNRLDLGGPNYVTDAACASSLSALRAAVAELEAGHADMMITGGVDTDNSIFMYMSFSKTPAFSQKNEIRPFDKGGDGMLIGEAVSMLIIKRLEDAERDGDKIYAVIKGIGSSSDGRFKSIYAPRPQGQMLALKRAYERADIHPSTIDLIEAHGTGTAAGDVAEFTSLRTLYAEYGVEQNSVALGTVKSQVGHTKAAAGAVSMLKTALALHHKILPPTINIDEPNPKLQIEDSAFYLNTQSRPWIRPAGSTPRRAGVSSFGFGGTNFHVILEEYEPEQSGAYRRHEVYHSVVLSAKSEADLKTLVQNALNDVQGDEAATKFEALVDASLEAIPDNNARVGFVAKDAADAAKKLQSILDMFAKKSGATDWSHPKGLYYRQSAMATDGNVVALFAGQGSQYTGMARELVLNFPEMRETFSALDAMFVDDNRPALSDVVFPIPAYDDETCNAQDEALQQTEYAQPAIGALSAGMFNIFKKAGFAPDFTAGHSFGEVTALWAAGVMDDETYYTLIRARGKAMAPPEGDFDAGTMAAVLGDVSQLESDLAGLPDVVIANHNSGKQVVIAGPTASIEQAQQVLADKGYRVSPLPVSAAFHTPLVGHAQSDFAAVVDNAKFKKAKARVFSNESGTAYPVTPKAIQNTLGRQILESVQFRQEIENIYNEGGRIFVEFGPRSILTNLTKEILGDKNDVVTIAMNASRRKDSDMQLRDAMVQLRVMGMNLGEFDGYDYEPPATPPKKRGMKVTLTGGNYVSDATRKAYQDALNDGHTVVTEKITEKVVQTAPVAPPKPAPVAQNGTSKIDDGLKTALSSIEAQRQQMQQVHEQFLQTQSRYNELYAGALQQQQTLIHEKGEWLTPEMQQQLNANLVSLQTQQQQIQQMHEQYMSEQSATLQSMLEKIESGAKPAPSANGRNGTGFQPRPMMKPMAAPAAAPKSAPVQPKPMAKPAPVSKPMTAPVIKPIAKPISQPAPVAAAQSNGIDVAELTGGMMEVVSEKTGYPVEMLEPEMDMEADLGIDSIKRVEILGEVQKRYPQLPEVKAEEMGVLRTLQEIVEYMASQINDDAAPVVSTPAPTPAAQPATTPTPAPVAAAQSNGIDVAELTGGMMEVVSEKTGYPVEMLEPEMDMEADLGIDSIKRVEILGEVQKRYPQLPEVKAEEMGVLRTLQEIVEYMASQINDDAAPVASTPAPTPVAQPVTTPTPAPVTAAQSNGIDVAELTGGMMEVVSEKTGYPVEMLEPEMDMEADLGIDSIKRVEILGEVQKRYPQLPEVKAEEMGVLRTLQEIVEYMASQINDDAAPVVSTPAPTPIAQPATTPMPAPVAAASPSSGIDVAELTGGMMEVVSEKTGYPVEMLEPEMDMEADLGIDSIKRVEILGEVQKRYPQLPEVKAEEMGVLRTLQEIVEYMASQINDDAAPVAQSQPATTPTPAPVASNGIDVAELTDGMMEVVSEKTGYPVEMLEPEMDMEADLGIDSIKRVEILGEVQKRYPQLPEVKAEEMGVLRTLQEIVEYMASQINDDAAPVVSTPALNPVAQPATTPTPAPVAAASPSSGIDVAELTGGMMEVVSEKTGYPVEMLEPEMDMEADLGIDSIKRVEILGEVQKRYPQLPEVKAEEMSVLRTLQEIVEYMASQVKGDSASAKFFRTVETEPADALSADFDYQGIHRAGVMQRFLPQPDMLQWTPAPGQICLITADGTARTQALVNAMAGQGWQTVVLSFPDEFVPVNNIAGTHHVVLDDMSEEHLKNTLENIASNYGQTAAFIHLNPKAQPLNGSILIDDEKLIVRHVFLMAKYLKADLNEVAENGRAAFMVVTTLDGYLGTTDLHYGALSGGLYGLVKTLNHEWQQVFCRAVDLAPSLDVNAGVQQILAELYDAKRSLTEVGYNEAGRITLTLQD